MKTIRTKSELAIDRNIRLTIQQMKRRGTVGASIDCLRMNTTTKGVDCPLGQYNELFEKIARRIAKQYKFSIL